MTAPLRHSTDYMHLIAQQAKQLRSHPIAVTVRAGGTTDADIRDRERDNRVNGH